MPSEKLRWSFQDDVKTVKDEVKIVNECQTAIVENKYTCSINSHSYPLASNSAPWPGEHESYMVPP